jgi:lactoylglutathione lyase
VEMTRALEVGVVVADLDLLTSFYAGALGCREVRRSAVPASINGPAGLGGATVVVWLLTPYGERIKLIRPDAPAAVPVPPGAITQRRGIGYLTFYVDDAEAALVRLRAAGAVVLSDPPLVQAHGKRIAFVTDPEGNVVELVDTRD